MLWGHFYNAPLAVGRAHRYQTTEWAGQQSISMLNPNPPKFSCWSPEALHASQVCLVSPASTKIQTNTKENVPD